MLPSTHSDPRSSNASPSSAKRGASCSSKATTLLLASSRGYSREADEADKADEVDADADDAAAEAEAAEAAEAKRNAPREQMPRDDDVGSCV